MYYFGFLKTISLVRCWSVLWFYILPFFGAEAIRTFVNTGPN